MRKEEYMRKELEQFIVSKLESWDLCKDRAVICVAPKNFNDDCVRFSCLDLDVYVRIIMFTEGYCECASCVVTDSLMKKWGISANELFDVAMENSRKQYRIDTMSDLVGAPGLTEQAVVRFNESMYGAGAIIFTDSILPIVADLLDSDLIVLPSSIHEIICMSVNDIEMANASQMVHDINQSAVEEHERLSDHAYWYHRESKVITW